MNSFKIYTPEDAPSPSDEMLRGVRDMLGFVPNIFGVLAEKPVALAAFAELNQKFAETSFTPEEREIVQMAVSTENESGYCVAGHTAFAVSQGVPDDVIGAVRGSGEIAAAKLDALQAFARAVVTKKGRISAADLDRFVSAGYSPAQIHEVILGVCVKTVTNLTSNLTGIPLDDAFAPHAWSAGSAQPAPTGRKVA